MANNIDYENVLEPFIRSEGLTEKVHRLHLIEPSDYTRSGIPKGYMESRPSLICTLESLTSDFISRYSRNISMMLSNIKHIDESDEVKVAQVLSSYLTNIIPEFKDVSYEISPYNSFHIGSYNKLNNELLDGIGVKDGKDQIYVLLNYNHDNPYHLELITSVPLELTRLDEHGFNETETITPNNEVKESFTMNHGDQIKSEAFPFVLTYVNKGNPQGWFNKSSSYQSSKKDKPEKENILKRFFK
jgi:hypothetical protein